MELEYGWKNEIQVAGARPKSASDIRSGIVLPSIRSAAAQSVTGSGATIVTMPESGPGVTPSEPRYAVVTGTSHEKKQILVLMRRTVGGRLV